MFSWLWKWWDGASGAAPVGEPMPVVVAAMRARSNAPDAAAATVSTAQAARTQINTARAYQ